jgi:hypothetical protein
VFGGVSLVALLQQQTKKAAADFTEKLNEVSRIFFRELSVARLRENLRLALLFVFAVPSS